MATLTRYNLMDTYRLVLDVRVRQQAGHSGASYAVITVAEAGACSVTRLK